MGRKTKTIIPAQPGFDLVELMHASAEAAQKGEANGFFYAPVLAWVLTVESLDPRDEDEIYIGVEAVTIEGLAINKNDAIFRQPDGSITFPEDAHFKAGDIDAAIDHATELYAERSARRDREVAPQVKPQAKTGT